MIQKINFEEIDRKGTEIYEKHLRKLLSTNDNIGKLLSIDVESGDYIIADDLLDSGMKLRACHPDSKIYFKRIRFNAVYSV